MCFMNRSCNMCPGGFMWLVVLLLFYMRVITITARPLSHHKDWHEGSTLELDHTYVYIMVPPTRKRYDVHDEFYIVFCP